MSGNPAANWRFLGILALLLSALLVFQKPIADGDIVEYSLTTIALADHGTPDIQLNDVARARALLPAYASTYDLVEKGMRDRSQELYAAFARGRSDDVYAVHFFGYSALVALPFKLFESFGLPPLKAYQFVNLVAVFTLGVALRRLFRSDIRALAGVGLFMLSGGILYASWTSPECLSAAALLAGLALFVSGAAVAASLLAGLAAQQNPTIIFFFAFAPLLKLALDYDKQATFRANLARVTDRRHVLALASGAAVLAIPPLFNLWQFGAPNIIAKLFSDSSLIGLTRLHAFFFDLNQGMLIGIPALAVAIALWGWHSGPQGWRREAIVLGTCFAFTLALVIPALAIRNWNSGAAGIMRYAFWSAMPLLFVLLLRLKRSPRWPVGMLFALVAVQAIAMAHAQRYRYVEFSPLARLVMNRAPWLYHPEPEIFVERMGHNDNYVDPSKVYVRDLDGERVTTLYNTAHSASETMLCGTAGVISAISQTTDLDRGWRYIDGPVHCAAASSGQRSFQIEQFQTQGALKLNAGWSNPEANGPGWNGVWSDGARSQLSITLGDGTPSTITVIGNYLAGNKRTRVRINGVDVGWHHLESPLPLDIPENARHSGALTIEFEHEAPYSPSLSDQRRLAFFMRELTLR